MSAVPLHGEEDTRVASCFGWGGTCLTPLSEVVNHNQDVYAAATPTSTPSAEIVGIVEQATVTENNIVGISV